MVALYDEQEIMDRFVASEKKESKIQTSVEDCKDFGLSKSEAVNRIIAKYNLLKDEAKEKVDLYWPE